MPASDDIDPAIREELLSVYKQVMWLARCPRVTSSMARAWYTHVVAERLKRRIRQFSGKVSSEAAENPLATIRLEHFLWIQTMLTSLVERHRTAKKPDPDEFIQVVLECERVHIVTFEENYSAMRSGGNYRKAGIKLVAWRSLPIESRNTLWTRMLRGRVANAAKFAPKP